MKSPACRGCEVVYPEQFSGTTGGKSFEVVRKSVYKFADESVVWPTDDDGFRDFLAMRNMCFVDTFPTVSLFRTFSCMLLDLRVFCRWQA